MNNPQAFASYSRTEAGMTLRDYFAAQALTGMFHLMAQTDARTLTPETAREKLAIGCYAAADALLDYRERTPTP